MSKNLGFLRSEWAKVRFDFRCAYVARMPLAIKQDEPPNPINVRLLGPIGVMFGKEGCSDLIEQFWRGDWRNCRGSGRRVHYFHKWFADMRTDRSCMFCVE